MFGRRKIDAVEKLAGTVGGVINKFQDKHLGKKELDALKTEIDKELQQGFRSFALAHGGAAADMPPSVQIIRSLVRPICTLALLGVLLWSFIQRPDTPAEFFAMIWKLNVLSLTFWFGPQALERLGLNLANFGKKKKGR